MKHVGVHKQLLLTTLALQREEVDRHVRGLGVAARNLSQATRNQVRTAGTWVAAASALLSLKAFTKRPPGKVPRESDRGRGSWAGNLLSLALALRPLILLFPTPRPKASPPKGAAQPHSTGP